MADFEFGPIELYLIGMGEEGLSSRTLGSLNELVDRGVLRLLDLAIIAKSGLDEVTIVEADDDDTYGATGADLAALGIASEEDIRDLAQVLPVGQTALLVAVELLWAKELSAGIAESGAAVLATERIPAPVVNAVLEAFDDEALQEPADLIVEER